MLESLLIIEDEKLLGSELSRHYPQMGCDVLLAKNLAEARVLLLEKKSRAVTDSLRYESTGR